MQGLCVGNGRLISAVNGVVSVYSTADGALLATLRSTDTSNVSDSSDPRCLFDGASRAFILAVITSEAGNLVVSFSVTPEKNGSWSAYAIPNRVDGDFADYPMMAMNEDVVVLSVNQFDTLTSPGDDLFKTGGVFLVDKRELVRGARRVHCAYFSFPRLREKRDNFSTVTVQPAVVQGGSHYVPGVVFFVMNPPWASGYIFVSMLAGTASWAASHDIKDLVYRTGNVTVETPHFTSIKLVQPQSDVYGYLDSLDDKLYGGAYAGGLLYTATGTDSERTLNDSAYINNAGSIFYIVRPVIDRRARLRGVLVKDGLVASPDFNFAFPTIGAAPDRRAVIMGSVLGARRLSSIGIVGLDPTRGVTTHVTTLAPPKRRRAPYRPQASDRQEGVARWQDYTSSVYDNETQRFYFAGEVAVELPDTQTWNWGTIWGAVGLSFPL